MVSKVAVTYSLERKLGPYAAAVKQAGLEPVPVSPGAPVGLAGLRGLVITGGSDIDPARYGETPVEANDAPDRARDELEARLLEEALASDLPVLAICRGLQLLNVVRGGTLRQDVPGHRLKEAINAHAVAIEPGSKLASIVGAARYMVNSRHHQAAGRPGAGLLVTARHPDDGVVEAIEVPDRRFAVAVQWHPEDRVNSHPADFALFRAFATAVE